MMYSLEEKLDFILRLNPWRKGDLDYLTEDEIPAELWADPEFVELCVVYKSYEYYKFVSDSLKKDTDWLKKLLREYPINRNLLLPMLKDAPSDFLLDAEFAAHLIRIENDVFNYLPEEYRSQQCFIELAFTSGNTLDLYEHLLEEQKKDWNLTLELAQSCANKFDDMVAHHPGRDNLIHLLKTSTDSAFYREWIKDPQYANDVELLAEVLPFNPKGYRGGWSGLSDEVLSHPDLIRIACLRCKDCFENVPEGVDLSQSPDETLRVLHAFYKDSGKSLESVPAHLWDDYQFVLSAVVQIESFQKSTEGVWFDKLQNFLQQKEFVLEIFQYSAAQSTYYPPLNIPAHFNDDKDVCLQILALYPQQYEFVSERLKADEDIINVVNGVGSILRKHGNRAFALLKHAPLEVFSNRENIVKFMQFNPINLEYARQFQDDVDIVRQSVQWEGYQLRYASERLRADRDLCLRAIVSNKGAFQYVAESLRADKDFVLKVLNTFKDSEYSSVLEYVSTELQDDFDVVLAACKKRGSEIEFASKRLQADSEISKFAALGASSKFSECCPDSIDDLHSKLMLVENFGNLQYCSDNIRKDKPTIRRVVSRYSSYVKSVHPDILEDITFLKELVQIDSNISAYLPKELTKLIAGQHLQTQTYRNRFIRSSVVPQGYVESNHTKRVLNVEVWENREDGEHKIFSSPTIRALGYEDHGPVHSYMSHSENNSLVLLGDFIFLVSERGLDGGVGSRSSMYSEDTDYYDRKNRVHLIDRTTDFMDFPLPDKEDIFEDGQNTAHLIALDKPLFGGLYSFGTTPHSNYSLLERSLRNKESGEELKYENGTWMITQTKFTNTAWPAIGGAVCLDTDEFGVCWLFPNDNKFYTWAELSESLKNRTDRKDWERLKADYLAEATSSEVRFLKVWSNRIEDATLRSEVHAYVDDLYSQLLESVDHLEQVNMLCQLGHQCLHSGDLPQAKENFDRVIAHLQNDETEQSVVDEWQEKILNLYHEYNLYTEFEQYLLAAWEQGHLTRTPTVFKKYADVLEEAGRLDECFEVYSKMLALPRELNIYYHYGWTMISRSKKYKRYELGYQAYKHNFLVRQEAVQNDLSQLQNSLHNLCWYQLKYHVGTPLEDCKLLFKSCENTEGLDYQQARLAVVLAEEVNASNETRTRETIDTIIQELAEFYNDPEHSSINRIKQRVKSVLGWEV